MLETNAKSSATFWFVSVICISKCLLREVHHESVLRNANFGIVFYHTYSHVIFRLF